jgi:hypothetical protein
MLTKSTVVRTIRERTGIPMYEAERQAGPFIRKRDAMRSSGNYSRKYLDEWEWSELERLTKR